MVVHISDPSTQEAETEAKKTLSIKQPKLGGDENSAAEAPLQKAGDTAFLACWLASSQVH